LRDELERLQHGASNGARAATMESRAVEERLRGAREKLRDAEEMQRQASLTVARYEQEVAEAQARLRLAASASPAVFGNPLLQLGVETRMFWRTTLINGATQSLRGLLVVGVRDGSTAARADLHAGDVIETINDQSSLEVGPQPKLVRDDNSPLTLGITRDSKKLTIKLNLEK
jgi:C-terminal processing protease CtpA/Prc